MLRLDQRLDELIGITYQQFGVEVRRPQVKFDLRGLQSARVEVYANLIAINPILLVENPDQFVEEVLGHEYCHITTHRFHPKAAYNHGRWWQGQMWTHRVPIKIDHTFDTRTLVGKVPKSLGTVYGKPVDRKVLDNELVIYQDYQNRIRGL